MAIASISMRKVNPAKIGRWTCKFEFTFSLFFYSPLSFSRFTPACLGFALIKLCVMALYLFIDILDSYFKLVLFFRHDVV